MFGKDKRLSMNRDKKSEAFRELLRIIGRGKKLQRDLTTEESREAMRLMLGDSISDAQIGGFLVTISVTYEFGPQPLQQCLLLLTGRPVVPPRLHGQRDENTGDDYEKFGREPPESTKRRPHQIAHSAPQIWSKFLDMRRDECQDAGQA